LRVHFRGSRRDANDIDVVCAVPFRKTAAIGGLTLASVDMSGVGHMVWLKLRPSGTRVHELCRRYLGVTPIAGGTADAAMRVSEAAEVQRAASREQSDAELIRLASLGLMTTGIVHDFGNLLQVVTSAIRLIERNLDQPSPVDMRPFTQGALESVGRAAALSKQILGFSRTENGFDEVVQLDAAIAAIENPIRWMAGPAIQVDLALNAVPAVFCNIRELENAVLNLVINAKDAMPEGGRLCIAVYADDRGRLDTSAAGSGPTVILRVTDTGCGMPPDIVMRAFQPRFTTKTAGRGNGLGLAMVQEFARRSGGSAWIESAVGEGTSVVLRLCGCNSQAEYYTAK
jgi:signal transduction histidine kinase